MKDAFSVSVFGQRFPHLGQQIFKEINNQSLVNCREVNTDWKLFCDNQKLTWIRMIEYSLPEKPISKKWQRFLTTSQLDIICEIAFYVRQISEKQSRWYWHYDYYSKKCRTPLHFIAMSGMYFSSIIMLPYSRYIETGMIKFIDRVAAAFCG